MKKLISNEKNNVFCFQKKVVVVGGNGLLEKIYQKIFLNMELKFTILR